MHFVWAPGRSLVCENFNYFCSRVSLPFSFIFCLLFEMFPYTLRTGMWSLQALCELYFTWVWQYAQVFMYYRYLYLALLLSTALLIPFLLFLWSTDYLVFLLNTVSFIYLLNPLFWWGSSSKSRSRNPHLPWVPMIKAF